MTQDNNNSFSKSFSDTFNKRTVEVKKSAGETLAKMLTSWKGIVWIIAIIASIICFCTGSTWLGIGILILALIVTCFSLILDLFL